jgi:hypothetical protein
MRRQQSRRGLGDTDGLAFVSHAGAVSFRDGTRSVSKLKTPDKEFPSPTSESYLTNSAILLDGQNVKDRGEYHKLPELLRNAVGNRAPKYWLTDLPFNRVGDSPLDKLS